MICLVDNETKSTSSRVIIYAFRKILLMSFKVLAIIQTMESCVFCLLYWRKETGKQKTFYILKGQIYLLIGEKECVFEGVWKNTFRKVLPPW